MKTVTLEDEVWEWLSKKKIELRADSISDVVNILIVDRVAMETKKK